MGNVDDAHPLLEAEKMAQVGSGERGDVTINPTIIINEKQYRGAHVGRCLSSEAVDCFLMSVYTAMDNTAISYPKCGLKRASLTSVWLEV